MEGLLARQSGTTAQGQKVKPVLQAIEDLAWRHHPDPGRGQFDCQRDSIEALADFRDRRCVRFVEREVWTAESRAIDKQLNSLRPRNLIELVANTKRRETEG